MSYLRYCAVAILLCGVAGTQTQNTLSATRPFPSEDLKNWKTIQKNTPISASQVVTTPMQFGDITVASESPLHMTVTFGSCEELENPADGDKIRRCSFLNTGEFIFFYWEDKTGQKIAVVLLQEDGRFFIGTDVTAPDFVVHEYTYMLQSVKIGLLDAEGKEVTSRTVQRKADPEKPPEEKKQ